jgi:SAM-dependent methyltransferase
MNKKTITSPGAMDANYALGRINKLHLIYRYQVRALMAVEALRRHRPDLSDTVLLDMGCAEGRTLLEIRNLLNGHGFFTGVEYAQELIDAAPPLPGDTRLVQGDVMNLPDEFADKTFDFVCCLAVLEHLTAPVACVSEAYRVLRPGGVFVASCPNPFWDNLAGRLGMVADDCHEIKVTGKALVDFARTAGFSEVIFEPFMWVFTGVMPYLGFHLSPSMSLHIDRLVRRFSLLHFSFVNQALIAKK